jgi:tetratricopeptide (TPR) repeat protein
VVTNQGGLSGNYSVILKINGKEEGRKEVTVASGSKLDVTFNVVKDEIGTYTVAVGESISSFTVDTKGINIQWWYIFAAIGTLAAGIAVFLFSRRWDFGKSGASELPASKEYVMAYNQGLEHYNRRDYDAAVQEFSKAINVDPKQLSAYINRGIAYYVKGENDKAILDFTQAITIDADNVLALYNRGLVYKALGQGVEAITDFENVIKIGTNTNLSKKVKKLIKEIVPSEK